MEDLIGATLVWADNNWGRSVFWNGRNTFLEYDTDIIQTGTSVTTRILKAVGSWTTMTPPEDKADAMEVARRRYARLLAEAS